MNSLTEQSSLDLAQLIVKTHDELSRGKPISTPENFLVRVREEVSEDDWKLAIRCTRSWGTDCERETDQETDDEMERMALELLWMSAMITELQQRDHSQEPMFESTGLVQ